MLLASATLHAQNYKGVQNLKAEIAQGSSVLLRWQVPTGQTERIQQIEVWRSETGPGGMTRIAEIKDTTVVSYQDFDVAPGRLYNYLVVTYYSLFKQALSGCAVWMPAEERKLHFTTRPSPTAVVGEEYVYSFSISVEGTDSVFTDFQIVEGPGGMNISSLGKLAGRLDWMPTVAGSFRVSLKASDRLSGAYVIQEFTINVAQPTTSGMITGTVFDSHQNRLSNVFIRVLQQSGDGSTRAYETYSGPDGRFSFRHVQAGNVYIYAEAPGDTYLAEWYNHNASLASTAARPLRAKDTMRIDFYLESRASQYARVSGLVLDINGQPIDHAQIDIISKKHFLTIGDLATIENPEIKAFLLSRGADTVVFSKPDGTFDIPLPVDREYYTIVSKKGYRTSFVADQTNALEARSFRVAPTQTTLNYTLDPLIPTSNSLSGTIFRQGTTAPVQGIVVLLESSLKATRGAGGSNTFKRFISTRTDQNGNFHIDNIPATSTTYSILAVPVETDYIPQYFSFNKEMASPFLSLSEDVNIVGAVQNITFDLPMSVRTGYGSIYGQVFTKKNEVLTPAPGTIVLAQDERTTQFVGFAITDSTGTYTISGLPVGRYKIFADNPRFGLAIQENILINYVQFNDENRSQKQDFIIKIATPVAVERAEPPVSLDLKQNYPNPFNPETTIEFGIPFNSEVRLSVYNQLGQEVAVLYDGIMNRNYYTITFDASTLPSGTYVYMLRSGAISQLKTMVVTK